MITDISSAELVDQRSVQASCGGVSAMTIWRWRHDESLGFPTPIKIRGRLYWRKAQIIAWLAEQGEEAA